MSKVVELLLSIGGTNETTSQKIGRALGSCAVLWLGALLNVVWNVLPDWGLALIGSIAGYCAVTRSVMLMFPRN